MNITKLAVIYYNIEKPDYYDFTNTKSATNARTNFIKSKNTLNKDRLNLAMELYLADEKQELENFIAELDT